VVHDEKGGVVHSGWQWLEAIVSGKEENFQAVTHNNGRAVEGEAAGAWAYF